MYLRQLVEGSIKIETESSLVRRASYARIQTAVMHGASQDSPRLHTCSGTQDEREVLLSAVSEHEAFVHITLVFGRNI